MVKNPKNCLKDPFISAKIILLKNEKKRKVEKFLYFILMNEWLNSVFLQRKQQNGFIPPLQPSSPNYSGLNELPDKQFLSC
jgi:hypothetical protein